MIEKDKANIKTVVNIIYKLFVCSCNSIRIFNKNHQKSVLWKNSNVQHGRNWRLISLIMSETVRCIVERYLNLDRLAIL